MNKHSFYVYSKICDYYAVKINDEGIEITEMVKENNIDGFIQCLKFFGYKQLF